MPNLLAHRLFIDNIIQCNSLEEKEIIALRLGTQGPDPMFYHGIIPWRSWHFIIALKKIGNKLHKENGRRFFLELKNECEKIKNPEEKKIFAAFCFGQISHLLLDRSAHPFIYYFSGFDDDGRITGRFHYEHANYESEIDCILATKNAAIDFREKTFECLPYDKSVYKIIDKNLVPVLNKMYGVKLYKKYYTNSICNFRSMQKMTTNKLLRILGKDNMFKALYTPNHVEKDVMNEKKAIWKNPVTGNESKETFYDLFDKAQDIAIKAFEMFKQKGITDELINFVCNDMDYRGVEVDSKLKYCYFRNN